MFTNSSPHPSGTIVYDDPREFRSLEVSRGSVPHDFNDIDVAESPRWSDIPSIQKVRLIQARDKQNVDTSTNPWSQGRLAGQLGLLRSDNPFCEFTQYHQHNQWDRAWSAT